MEDSCHISLMSVCGLHLTTSIMDMCIFSKFSSFSPQPDATFRDSKSSFSSAVFILLCKLDNSEHFRHGVARVVQYTQTATFRQRQLANRSTGSRFAVNAFHYTRNLINHLSLDGNAHRKSIYKTIFRK